MLPSSPSAQLHVSNTWRTRTSLHLAPMELVLEPVVPQELLNALELMELQASEAREVKASVQMELKVSEARVVKVLEQTEPLVLEPLHLTNTCLLKVVPTD